MQSNEQEQYKATGETSLGKQSLASIVTSCREESTQRQREEKGYCFELFRRAVEEGDEAAWTAVQRQYEQLIIHWLQQMTNEPLLPEDRDDLLQEIYTKFWLSLTKRPMPLSGQFAHVGALIKYLNRCALTTLLDAQRRRWRQEQVKEMLTRLARAEPPVNPYEGKLANMEHQARLSRVHQWMKTEVTDSLEKLLLTLVYEEGLRPREIVARYPQQFPDTYHVRRVKVRILQRARRALA